MWQALRVGMTSEAMLTNQIKLSVDVAYLPWVNFSGLDTHWARGVVFPETSKGGQGVQLEGLLSYYFTPMLSVGVGGRYWAAWTTNGSDYDATEGSTPTYFRAALEQATAFAQVSYKFGVPGWVAARDTQ
jgi:outer membrane protease